MKIKEEKIINDLVYFDNLKIVQNKNYFNFSLDSILLPNFAPITENTKNILGVSGRAYEIRRNNYENFKSRTNAR